jgi:two-component system sensor histidine kinase DegS
MAKLIDLTEVNKIMGEIIVTIDKSKNQLIEIVETARDEYEMLSQELNVLKNKVDQVIMEVDRLMLKDKLVRKHLADVSKDFKTYKEADIKRAYENATDVKVDLMSAEKEEQLLKQRRSIIEVSLKRSLKNIHNAEQVVHQVTVAATYLKGEILSALGDAGMDPMSIGVKILEAQENERLRVSRDIHDGPAQFIASIVMKADFCEMLMASDVQKGLAELRELKDLSRKALKEVRGIIHDLRPMSLEDLGLSATIESYVFEYGRENNVDVQFKSGKVINEIEPIIKVAVYRLVQELLNNIKKHAQCKNIILAIEYGTKYMRLTVMDDGIGFDVDGTLAKLRKKQISYGLLGIYERVEQFKGEIQFHSKTGEGTTVTIKLPVTREVTEHDE